MTFNTIYSYTILYILMHSYTSICICIHSLHLYTNLVHFHIHLYEIFTQSYASIKPMAGILKKGIRIFTTDTRIHIRVYFIQTAHNIQTNAP